MMVSGGIHAGHALLPEGWCENVRITWADGAITAVEPDAALEPGDERHACLLPGIPSLHSHAFQRAMAGLAERRGPGSDSFWSWRETMYRFALRISPNEAEAIAAQAYVEMLESGFTRVGEFHYLHHAEDGSPYDDPAEMAVRIAAAASAAGIGLTLLPVFYAHAGFGGTEPGEGQRRFVNSRDGFAQLWESAGRAIRSIPGAVLGVAPHSLRAVMPDELLFVAGLAEGPVHIHVAEQMREVADCLEWSGQRPVEWLLAHAPVDPRWCLIHATHMTQAETRSFAETGAVAGLCPETEANLGDGIFSGPEFLASGGRFGVGTDSNVRIDLPGELRQLEYSQRLGSQARNVLAAPQASTGRALFEGALAGGAQALGTGLAAGLAPGSAADMISLRATDTGFFHRDDLLDAWIFAGQAQVDCVWAGGRRVVADGRHMSRDAVREKFRAAMRRLLRP